ncbi:hypothetical protein BLA29_015448 [Euroglyphus maynei]|uniref:Uncharacterized protein n=1 Tax=Euroglyphus maynei TaxID=6958 RepID=A0A1Y3B5T8_EURMA|nr:hypothetical protein BLA29_015448 [Euroglyphus maynei]
MKKLDVNRHRYLLIY